MNEFYSNEIRRKAFTGSLSLSFVQDGECSEDDDAVAATGDEEGKRSGCNYTVQILDSLECDLQRDAQPFFSTCFPAL